MTPKEEAKAIEYVLAFNKKEAESLKDAGFGFETKAEARQALKEMKADKAVDSYYASQYKIFEV